MRLFRLLGCILYVLRLFPVALQSSFIVLSCSTEYFVSIGPFLFFSFPFLHCFFLFPLGSLVFGD